MLDFWTDFLLRSIKCFLKLSVVGLGAGEAGSQLQAQPHGVCALSWVRGP